MFESGLQYVRADFHLHTLKDKEFTYSGESTSFVGDYVSALKNASINGRHNYKSQQIRHRRI